jgi:hypothetical protein
VAPESITRAFFEDLARIEDGAISGAREALSGPEVPVWVASEGAVATLRAALTSRDQVDAMATFVRDMVRVALHSVLVAIDGGAASAEVGRLELVDERGKSLGEALHEDYVGYLMDTGRM